MHALITNDDGVDSPGIHALARVAAGLGLDVTVAAPGWDSSGASASLTAVEHEGRVLLEPRQIDGLDAVSVLALEAAPAFIARLGAEGALGPIPDIVLSGINRGANLGQAVLHSGTVGAALTARTHGRRAIAFSLDVNGDIAGSPHWDTAETIAGHVIRWALAATGPLVLNVNIPDRPLDEVRGLRPATLASFGAVQTTVTESGRGYVRVAYTQTDAEAEEGTDAALLADGFASYTALAPVCVATDTDTAGLGWDPASTTNDRPRSG